MPRASSVSLTKSSAARPTPMALAATIGRVASKVAITPLKPSLVFGTSGLPRMLASGTRQSSNTSVAVSEALMPSLFSTFVTYMPAVPASTTKALMPARPAERSSVAHTTTNPSDFSAAMRPLVQKIFVPFSTQWSPSRSAVVVIAELSDPQPGSVIAIAAHLGFPPALKRDRKRSFCSGVPAAATAAPPSPLFGIERYRPASPHESSSMETHIVRLRSDGPSFGFFSPPIGVAPETAHMVFRKSHGFSCSRSSYSRAIGRIIWSATWCTICRVFLMPSDSSKSIMSSPLKIRLPYLEAHSDDGEAVDGREAARVAEPELDRMLADVAVPAEHLH